jgi:hypothetical protein
MLILRPHSATSFLHIAVTGARLLFRCGRSISRRRATACLERLPSRLPFALVFGGLLGDQVPAMELLAAGRANRTKPGRLAADAGGEQHGPTFTPSHTPLPSDQHNIECGLRHHHALNPGEASWPFQCQDCTRGRPPAAAPSRPSPINQPLLPQMAASFGRSSAGAGLIATLTQLGYATGLFPFPLCRSATGRRRLILFSLPRTCCVLRQQRSHPILDQLLVRLSLRQGQPNRLQSSCDAAR